MKVKGGAVVDPDSGLVDSASVWREGKDVFSAILNAVDVQVCVYLSLIGWVSVLSLDVQVFNCLSVRMGVRLES